MTTWKPERDIVAADDPDRSDEQVSSKAWSRRFYLDGNPWNYDGQKMNSVVTVHWYVEQHPGDGGWFRIARESEYVICTDPARPDHTARWDDAVYEYEEMTTPTPSKGEAEAEAYARRYSPDQIDWDGRHRFP